MFQKLVSHNDDIRRLVEKGYAVSTDGVHLIVQDIPYLDAQRQLQWAAFVAKLVFTDAIHVIQEDHQLYFTGGVPHNLDGTPAANLNNREQRLVLNAPYQDLMVQRVFSNKPVSGRFENFFDKIENYVAHIAAPAMELHRVTPLTFKVDDRGLAASVFKFQDTLTSRAEITALSNKFSDEVIAIIGLGGTGSYVLDFLVKTPVREIRGFDLDPFHVHNAYRSPGRLLVSELQRSKAEVYQDRYESFREGLKLRAKIIDDSCADDLDGVTFAFVCVDKGSSRGTIFDLLIAKGIPYIDVGMGPSLSESGSIKGMLRVTYYSREAANDVRAAGHAQTQDAPADLYRTNIQIGELNALNAALAVIRYKQLRGFYESDVEGDNLVFDIRDLKTAA